MFGLPEWLSCGVYYLASEHARPFQAVERGSPTDQFQISKFEFPGQRASHLNFFEQPATD
jgi:hypothetical protein